jgi:PhzF family phenazine biosynthesis protein
MKLRQYQVDAFARRAFAGNPAAVCPLEGWLDDTLLQAIAAENNLSETAFFVLSQDGFQLRWLTPVAEVDLCGHATLATAHVLFAHLGQAGTAISFQTRSGPLTVRRRDGLLEMDFPARPPAPCACPERLAQALGRQPLEVLRADDYLAVFDDEASVRGLAPDFALLATLDLRGVIVTAPGRDADFVSRFFAPKLGIPEDPVTGSAHCTLAPYWAGRLGQPALAARQVSRRGGRLLCVLRGDRVLLSGCAVTFMEGEITFEAGDAAPRDGPDPASVL